MRSIVCVLPLFVLVLMLSYADAKEKRTDEKNHDSKHDSMTGDSDKTKLHGKMMMMEKHFIEMMISHHQEAVDMANLAVEKSRKDYIKSFSENIVKAQNSEIALMKKFYKEWYGADVPADWKTKMKADMKDKDMHGKSMMMMEMCMGHDMMGGSMDELKNAQDFDRAFLKMMIRHHKMAVVMSGMVIDSQRPELRKLARDIISVQSDEIEKMIEWQAD